MFARVRKARVLADSNGDVSPRARASAPAWSSTGEPFPPSCAMPGVAARSCSGAAETTKSVPHGVPFDNAYDVAAAYADPSSAVVIAGLQELNAIAEDLVDQAIGLVDAPRPEVAAEILEVVGLPNAARGIPERRLHQVQHAQRGLPVGIHPEAQVGETLLLEYRVPRALGRHAQGDTPSSRRSVAKSVAFFRPRLAPVSAASKRTAFSGDRRR